MSTLEKQEWSKEKQRERIREQEMLERFKREQAEASRLDSERRELRERYQQAQRAQHAERRRYIEETRSRLGLKRILRLQKQQDAAVRQSLLQGCMASELDSASAAAHARLLLAFVMRSSQPAEELGRLLASLLGQSRPAESDAADESSSGSAQGAVAPAPDISHSDLMPSRFLVASALVRNT